MPAFFVGNRKVLLGTRRFSWSEIAPPSLLKKCFFLKLSLFSKRFSSTELKLRTWEKYRISINGKKKFKRILSCLFDGTRKVHVTKFAFRDFIFVVFCCELGRHIAWVRCTRQRSRPKYSTASAFWFFLTTTMAFEAVRTNFPRKNTRVFISIGNLSREKK